MNNEKYLVVDCLKKITSSKFSELSWSVVVALGYITGQLFQNDEYLFAYDNFSMENFVHFSYSRKRDTLTSIYTPVNSNPYAWIRDNQKVADSFYGKINLISGVQFSKLVQLVLEEQEIRGILLLIVESSGRSLLLMPAGFSVALEGLSEFFAKKNSEKIKPIQDKIHAKNLRLDFIKVLETYKDKKSFTGYDIILNKLQMLTRRPTGIN